MTRHTVKRWILSGLIVMLVHSTASEAVRETAFAAPDRAPAAAPVVFVVDSLLGSSDAVLDGVCLANSGGCTLIAAAAEANYLAGTPVTITFSVSGSHLIYSGFNFTNPAGVLIDGTGQDVVLTNDWYFSGFAIFVEPGATLTMKRVAVSGINRAGIPDNIPGFSAILNDGTLRLDQVTVSDNGMGGIWNQGVLEVNRSTISGNIARDAGGGIYGSGTMTVANSTISGNQTQRYDGGGIQHFGALTLVNTTVTGNSAGASGEMAGGGVSTLGGTTTLTNSIVSGNWGAGVPDCKGAVNAVGPNLIGSTAGCTITGQAPLVGNPLLGPLVGNGGPTFTHLPSTSSPVLQAGDGVVCAGAPVLGVDQRGIVRPAGAHCSLGATEGATALSALAIADSAQLEGNSGFTSFALNLTLTPASASPVTVRASSRAGGAQPAMPDVDYEPIKDVTVTFAPGETRKTLAARVYGDGFPEPEETFTVRLSSQTGAATLQKPEATITIQNDDGQISGGRKLRLTVDTMRLSWDNGTLQTGYVVFRHNATTGKNAILATLPGTDVAFQDTTTLPNELVCYALISLDGSIPLGVSDVVCAMPGTGTTPAGVRNLAVGLSGRSTALLTWGPLAIPIAVKLVVVPLDGSATTTLNLADESTQASHPTGGIPTCFTVVSFSRHSDLVCVVPDTSTLKLSALDYVRERMLP